MTEKLTVGRREVRITHADRLVLQAAAAYEQVAPWAQVHPSL